MKYKFCLSSLVLPLLLLSNAFSQVEDSIEVYLIDAYVRPEIPHTFILSYFTSDYCKSTLIIEERYSYKVSEEATDMHKIEIDISKLNFNLKIVGFVIETETELGNNYTSELFDFDLPYEPEIEGGSDLVQLCLFGGTIFLLPYPNLIIQNGESHFALTKDIPVLSFRSSNINYPSSYISLEYTHIFDSNVSNFLRAGYKKIFEVDFMEFIAPGLSAYTNFSGSYGLGIELSAGLFTIEDTFTLYSRYRYNFKPGDSSTNFHELSIGLYSGFFSFYIQ
jgi:hypothetical protein